MPRFSKGGAITTEQVIAKLPALTPSSRPMVERFVTTLIQQNPSTKMDLLVKIADCFKLLKFRAVRMLVDPDEREMFTRACNECLIRKLDERDDADGEEGQKVRVLVVKKVSFEGSR